jgi:hypothetical protein
MSNPLRDLHILIAPPLKHTAVDSWTCRLAVQFGDFWFPEEPWIDFIVVIKWWVEDLEERGHRSCYFMDGPFIMHLDDVEGDPDLVELTFVRTRANETEDVWHTGVARKSQFRDALTHACRQIAALLREGGYEAEAERYERTASRHTN